MVSTADEIKIGDITPKHMWDRFNRTIRGRCTVKQDIHEFVRNGATRHVFNFHLQDASSEIKIVAWGAEALRMHSQVMRGSSYALSSFAVKLADPKWNATGHKCELHLLCISELVGSRDVSITKDASVPPIIVNPVKLRDVKAVNVPNTNLVDVIAVVKSCGDVKVATRSYDSVRAEKRSVVLVDETASVKLALWGARAREDGAELAGRVQQGEHPVLVIKGAYIDERRRNLGTHDENKTTILVDAKDSEDRRTLDVPGVPELKRWWRGTQDQGKGGSGGEAVKKGQKEKAKKSQSKHLKKSEASLKEEAPKEKILEKNTSELQKDGVKKKKKKEKPAQLPKVELSPEVTGEEGLAKTKSNETEVKKKRKLQNTEVKQNQKKKQLKKPQQEEPAEDGGLSEGVLAESEASEKKKKKKKKKNGIQKAELTATKKKKVVGS